MLEVCIVILCIDVNRQNSVKNNFNNLNLNQNQSSNHYNDNIENYSSKYLNFEIKSDEDFQKVSSEHERLINQILQEEEHFISLHKTHIDDCVDIIKNV